MVEHSSPIQTKTYSNFEFCMIPCHFKVVDIEDHVIVCSIGGHER